MSVLQLLGRRKKSEAPVNLVPGTPYGGGYYVGRIRVSGKLYNLVVAPAADTTSLAYKTTSTADTGNESVNDGLTNSNAINDANHPAAKYCRDYRGGGYNDWYLGSRDEHELAYRNLKPLVAANTTAVKDAGCGGGLPGINLNSDPQGAAYAVNIPTQTEALNFRGTNPVGLEAFNSSGPAYWTSTQSLDTNKNNAICRFYSNGLEMTVAKNNATGLVRPMRRILVENPDIGSYYEGGYYFGNIKIGPEEYRLVVAPQSTETIRAYKTSAAADTDSYSFVDGLANCQGKNNSNYPAIQYCMGLNIDGYTDWYLGARDEAELLYRNLKPTDGPNSFGVRQADAGGGYVGENPNSLPVGVAYTTTIPRMTTVASFQTGGSQVIGGVNQKATLWTSTATPAGTVPANQIYQNLYNGIQTTYPKTNTTDVGVRAIRRVHIAPKYGEARDGGYFGGRIKIGEDYYDLIVAPASAESPNLFAKTEATSTPGSTSTFDGLANTNSQNDNLHPAAKYCKDYRGGGYDDWYLGSMDEYEAIYRNLKSWPNNNSTGVRDVGLGGGLMGQNRNSSPIGYAYTANNPSQTKVADFISGTGSQAFSNEYYWTSTECVGAGYGPYQVTTNFLTGNQTYGGKSSLARRVRPIRRVKLIF